MENITEAKSLPDETLGRRQFLQLTGTGVAATLIGSMSACTKKQNGSSSAHDIGTGDVALLNLIYALQQLEEKFYVKADDFNNLSNTSQAEKSFLRSIKQHEIAHAAVLKTYLNTAALPELTPDFGNLDINDRTQILSLAKLLENNSIAAMNSLAYRLQSNDVKNFVVKMASVDARHAAFINNILSPGTFTDNVYVDPDISMERPKTISEILSFINSYLPGKITANNL